MSDSPSRAAGLVRVLLNAVDAADFDTIEALTAEDVHFRFGNSDPTETRSELLAAARTFRAGIAGLRHDLVDVWEIGDDVVVATMDVCYRRLDERELLLPCCNVFRVAGRLVQDYRIYMDVNPVIAP